MTTCLAESADRYGVEVHAVVQMSNHLHLILATPGSNLDDGMRFFLSTLTRKVQNLAGRTNHVFGARYKWSVLDSAYAMAYVYKYVYRNPVRAGICRRVEDYHFSTLTNFETPLALSEGTGPYWSHIPRPFPQRLEWLNHPTDRECELLIGRALRRTRFKFTTTGSLQKQLRELRDQYGIETLW